MKPNKIIIILFINIVNFSLLIAVTNNNKHILEFTTGGGAKLATGFSFSKADKKMNYYFDNSNYPPNMFIGLTFPTSIVFYQNKIFGLGFNYKLAFQFSAIAFSDDEGYWIFDLENTINLVNKIGNYEYGKFLLVRKKS